jgi:hypothetical protein
VLEGRGDEGRQRAKRRSAIVSCKGRASHNQRVVNRSIEGQKHGWRRIVRAHLPAVRYADSEEILSTGRGGFRRGGTGLIKHPTIGVARSRNRSWYVLGVSLDPESDQSGAHVGKSSTRMVSFCLLCIHGHRWDSRRGNLGSYQIVSYARTANSRKMAEQEISVASRRGPSVFQARGGVWETREQDSSPR